MAEIETKVSYPKDAGVPTLVKPFLVDVSIGHGPRDKGASSGGKDPLLEWDFNHSMVRPAIEEVAKASPYREKIRLRFWDAADNPGWGVRDGKHRAGRLLLDRLVAMYQRGATPAPRLAVELHCNASRNGGYGGSMAIYRLDKEDAGNVVEDERGKRLAEDIMWGLGACFPTMKNRGPQGDMGDWVDRNLSFTKWGFRYGSAPVIVEFGFVTHPGDVEVMRDKDTPAKYARALLDAFVKNVRGLVAPRVPA